MVVCGRGFRREGKFFRNCRPQINASVTVHDEMPDVGVERVGRMAGKHRRRSGRSKKIAAIGVATVTATALTVGVAPPPKDHAEQLAEDVDLMAAINPWPAPDQIPDLTGGLGSAAYDFNQAIADVLIRALVDNINLAALAQAAGLSPDAVLDTLLGGVLGQLPANLLDNIIGQLPIDVSGVVAALLAPLGEEAADLVGILVAGALPNTLGGLLGLLGLDLSDVLNLSDLNVPGLNIVTAGAPFTLLKLLGADLGWVPGLPNSVASEINNSPYLDLEVGLSDVLGSLPLVGQTVIGLLNGIGITIPDLDVAEVRVSAVVGFGLGAFAAGMAYEQVLADLANQPGGPTASEHPLLGSITVLPMILLRNPGRANGGLFARFYPLAGLFGIDTVTPETEVTGRGGVPLLNTGLRLGGANLIPVKVDGTVMFDPLSDFAAWPNPFSLANNLMAGLLPTYILRGLTLDTITEQLTFAARRHPRWRAHGAAGDQPLPHHPIGHASATRTAVLAFGSHERADPRNGIRQPVQHVGQCAGACVDEPGQSRLHRCGLQSADRCLRTDFDRGGRSHPILLVPERRLGPGAGRHLQPVDAGAPEGILQRQPDGGNAERAHQPARLPHRRHGAVGQHRRARSEHPRHG